MARLTGQEYVRAFREKLATGRNTLNGIFFGVNLKEPERRFEMEELYLGLINSAARELHITMAYFSPLKPFVEALIAAHQRGVRVTIVMPENANFQNDSNRRTARQLLKATGGGIRVYFSPKMLHTKLVMNEEMISFGSTNITKKAFQQLNELNLFVPNTDSEFQRALIRSVQDDILGARLIKSHRDVRYNPFLAFLEGFVV